MFGEMTQYKETEQRGEILAILALFPQYPGHSRLEVQIKHRVTNMLVL